MINGGQLNATLPHALNVERVDRPNRGLEFCGVKQVLDSLGVLLSGASRFAFFVFINSSVRGPFVPTYSVLLRMSWVSALTSLLSESTRLVGISFNCCDWPPTNCPSYDSVHLQSFVLATDLQV